jgi:hypothetical protein
MRCYKMYTLPDTFPGRLKIRLYGIHFSHFFCSRRLSETKVDFVAPQGLSVRGTCRNSRPNTYKRRPNPAPAWAIGCSASLCASQFPGPSCTSLRGRKGSYEQKTAPILFHDVLSGCSFDWGQNVLATLVQCQLLLHANSVACTLKEVFLCLNATFSCASTQ